jgi:ABC-type glycerol-3-phosphate transport system substrate-binding protein
MTIRPRLAGAALALAVVAGACGGTTPTGSAPTGGLPSVAIPSFAESAQLEATLPTSVGGVTLQTGSLNVLNLYLNGNTAANFLTVMIAGLGVSPAQVGVAAAADSGGQIQIAAGQFNGVTSAAIQTQIETVAKAQDPNVTLANTTIGGKSVTTATYPNSHTGPVVAYVTGDTLYLLQSSNPALVEDALKQLP